MFCLRLLITKIVFLKHNISLLFRHEARRKACPFLKFTDNVDLSDSRKWKGQMSELTKLPSWARVVSAGNMLSHLGYPIQGIMNYLAKAMAIPVMEFSREGYKIRKFFG